MENNNNNLKESFPWLRTGKDIIDLGLDSVPTLIDPLFPKFGAVVLAGSSDLGKSYFLLQAACSIIKGEDNFLGFTLNVSHKSAIYLSTEDDDYSLCPRLRLLAKNTEPEVFEKLLLFNETRDLEKRLDDLLEVHPADIVVIDTFADIYDGDLNQSNRVRYFLQKFKEVAYRRKTLIVFNHHVGKKNDYRPPHKDNLLGSQGLESSMRTAIELRKDFNDPDIRHLCVVKGNYLSEHYKNDSFVLSFNYEDGFFNTGERTNFSRLIKTDGQQQQKTLIEKKVLALREENLSYSKIEEKLSEEGLKVSRSKIGNICKAYRPSIQESIEDEMDVQLGDDMREVATNNCGECLG